jgi:NADPH2 dehydrogenase
MGSVSQSKLFEPLTVGHNTLSNRLVMAPLTRFRADDNHVPLPMVKEYYAQRACVPGTLLITEATVINKPAGGYPNVPQIFSDEQIAAWKEIADAVHAKGSFLWLQLWALGRVADQEFKRSTGSGDLISSSDVPVAEGAPAPRPMTEQEIQEYIQAYAAAAANAVKKAGLDGVEIHAANGYLIDQFTQDTCNNRTDAWGGSVEKRSRFALEVSKAVVEAVGAERTGIRLSPWSTFQGMKMADPIPQFTHLINGLKEMKLAYLHLVEARIAGNADIEAPETNDAFIEAWGNTSPVFLAGGFKPDTARDVVDKQWKNKDVAVVFGRYWISTPDLVFRIEKGIELTPYNRDLFYNAKEAKGYTDYPFSEEFSKQQAKKV